MKIYVRITLDVPGAAPTTHVAELQTTDNPQLCTMNRIIELADGAAITGLAQGSREQGMTVLPQEVVPHPDSYSAMPDIQAETITDKEFEGLWEEALQKFPNF